MAASTKDRKGSDRDKAARAKEKERAAKQKEKERAAKAKEKEKAAREKEKAAKAKEKEKAAKAKEKEKAAKAKEKEKAAKAKEKEKAAKEKEKAAKAKEKEKAAKAKEKEKAAKQEEKDRAAAQDAQRASDQDSASAGTASADDAPVQPVEETAVPERGETTEVPAQVREGGTFEAPDFAANDKTVHPKGYLAEVLGKEDLVGRSTQRPTVAASFTTRDHDLIRAWAESRGGRPADVAGTGNRGAGVLRIEFPDGPGDDGRLEDVDWSSFFATFDDSDVDFLYQERVRTGDVSRFHKFVRADA